MKKDKAKFKAKIKTMVLKKESQRVYRGWNRLKGAYLLTRMKKFEGKSIKALLRADDCQDKILAVLPEIEAIKADKANFEDLANLSDRVQKINYQSIYNDLVTMIKEESAGLYSEIDKISLKFSHYLQEFNKEIKSLTVFQHNSENKNEIAQVKSQVNSLNNMQALLNERISRIDFCNIKEDNEFKIELLSKKFQNLENKLNAILTNQETTQDQMNIRQIYQFNNPTSKTSMKLSSTSATKGIESTPNVLQNIESELSVSGVYLKPNKRVSSACPNRKKIYGLRAKHSIPTSFSNTLSVNESPNLWLNKAN